MKKTLLSILAMVYAVFLVNIANAELKLSGYQEFYMGSADQSTQLSLSSTVDEDRSYGNLSNGRFTRLIAVGTTTLDSGITVTGTYTIAKDVDNGGDADTDGVAVDQNDIIFSGNFGNLAIGNNFSTGSMMHYRGTTLVPTAEPDNNQYERYHLIDTTNFGAYDEVGYALDHMRIRYMSNVYEGFSFGADYSSCSTDTSANASKSDCNSATTQYSDRFDVVAKYEMPFEGGSFGLTYGMVTANSPFISGTTKYNDVEVTTWSAQVKYAGLTAIYRYNDAGDSLLDESNTDDGDDTGSTLAARYDMGNFSVGYFNVETETKITGQSLMNDQTISGVSFGYNLGGGVNIEGAYMSHEENQANAKYTDADVVLTKLSFGF